MAVRIRAMSYNIRHDAFDDGVEWTDRRDAVADVIRAHGADVVGLQEAHGYQFEDVSERLPDHDWVGHGDRTGEFNPIGYRRDRFELVEGDVRWLSEHPEVPESVGWDAAFARVLTSATVRERDTGSVLTVFNTHFDHEGSLARRESARLIRELVDGLDPRHRAVALGDFNADESDAPYEVMTSDGFERPVADARRVAAENGHDPGTTRTSFDALVPDRRIDHVFVTTDLPVRRYAIPTDTHDGGQFPSDHLPVLAEFALDGERSR